MAALVISTFHYFCSTSSTIKAQAVLIKHIMYFLSIKSSERAINLSK